jgi:hypothetical protein
VSGRGASFPKETGTPVRACATGREEGVTGAVTGREDQEDVARDPRAVEARGSCDRHPWGDRDLWERRGIPAVGRVYGPVRGGLAGGELEGEDCGDRGERGELGGRSGSKREPARGLGGLKGLCRRRRKLDGSRREV